MRAGLLAALVALLAGCSASSPQSEPPPASPLPSSATATPAPPQPTTPGGTLAPCPREDPTRLSVLTLNIHSGRTKSGELDLDRITDELRAWEPDVVMLQEVDAGRARSGFAAQARQLARGLGRDWAYGANRRLDPGTSGNALLSRFPITASRNRPLPRLPGLFRRGLLQATLDVDGRAVTALATHLDHLRPAARRAQALAVASVAERIGGPVLLGGDLNAEPGLPPLAILNRAGLADPWPMVGDDDGETVPAADPQRRIDYVLADDSFVPLRSEVLISLVSDHRAVRTMFELLARDC